MRRFHWWAYMPLRVSILCWMCQVFNWGLVLISELILSCSTSMLSAGGLNWQCKEKVRENYHCTLEFLWLNWLIILSKEHWEAGRLWAVKKWQNSFKKELACWFLHSQIFRSDNKAWCEVLIPYLWKSMCSLICLLKQTIIGEPKVFLLLFFSSTAKYGNTIFKFHQ